MDTNVRAPTKLFRKPLTTLLLNSPRLPLRLLLKGAASKRSSSFCWRSKSHPLLPPENFAGPQNFRKFWRKKKPSIFFWFSYRVVFHVAGLYVRHFGRVSFCTFWLGNVLLATAACNFSTSELSKMLWDPQLFSILTWKCPSRHSDVQFFDTGTSKNSLRSSTF